MNPQIVETRDYALICRESGEGLKSVRHTARTAMTGLSDHICWSAQGVRVGLEDLVKADTASGETRILRTVLPPPPREAKPGALSQFAHDKKDILQRNVVNLKLLPRGDVNMAAAP